MTWDLHLGTRCLCGHLATHHDDRQWNCTVEGCGCSVFDETRRSPIMTADELCVAAVSAYREGLPGWRSVMVGGAPAEACVSGKASVEIRVDGAVWMVRIHRDPQKQLTGECDVIAPDGAATVVAVNVSQSSGMGGLG